MVRKFPKEILSYSQTLRQEKNHKYEAQKCMHFSYILCPVTEREKRNIQKRGSQREKVKQTERQKEAT